MAISWVPAFSKCIMCSNDIIPSIWFSVQYIWKVGGLNGGGAIIQIELAVKVDLIAFKGTGL